MGSEQTNPATATSPIRGSIALLPPTRSQSAPRSPTPLRAPRSASPHAKVTLHHGAPAEAANYAAPVAPAERRVLRQPNCLRNAAWSASVGGSSSLGVGRVCPRTLAPREHPAPLPAAAVGASSGPLAAKGKLPSCLRLVSSSHVPVPLFWTHLVSARRHSGAFSSATTRRACQYAAEACMCAHLRSCSPARYLLAVNRGAAGMLPQQWAAHRLYGVAGTVTDSTVAAR